MIIDEMNDSQFLRIVACFIEERGQFGRKTREKVGARLRRLAEERKAENMEAARVVLLAVKAELLKEVDS